MSKFLLVLLSISILFIEAKTKTFKTIKVATSKSVEVINGYTLPPEPDEKINNSTLLGINSNKNGIRDYDMTKFSEERSKCSPEVLNLLGGE
jgi:hypothetical protein